jgi:uncharacterized membrane protein YeaQ/YmgE (transglycosylase-associated protein family)
MSILGWIIFGLIVGVVAKLIMPGRDPGGMIVTILLGIAGALVAGFLGRALGWYGDNDPVGFVMATIGAILLLVLYRQFRARPTT